ncbi:MAG: tetratricopeptide repeat protein [Planctomycetes bacterium]|nr:tetratricopeptide repeat protein [Planctomycetota bacterium]
MPATESQERRVVCVVFAQASGLAELPESERTAIADALFRRLRLVVESHGGSVDKFIGDVVMALWGAPKAHEDDEARALRASLEMARETATFASHHGVALGLRAGVNRGEVLYGRVGGDRATVMGDAVNVAQRLEAAAASGQVLASAAVETLARGAFEFQAIPPLHLKGREESVSAFAVTGGSPGRTARLDAAPMVGRSAEIERLTSAVSAGRGAFLWVEGEAGVGKSRLVGELRARLRLLRPGLRIETGRATDAAKLPMYALGEAIGQTHGERLAPALAEALAAAGASAGDARNWGNLIAISLGRAVEDSNAGAVEPARLKAETHWAWEQWMRALLARGPLLLCLEDLHVADDGTIDLLACLASRLAAESFAVVATARPGARRPGGFEAVALGELPADAATALAASILGGPLAPDLEAFLAKKSGGNPYYIEELARFLLENRLAVGLPLRLASRTERVPDGLQGLLVARLDGLAADEKEVVKGASVVGQEFWELFLAGLLDREVHASLAEASRRGMVLDRPASLLPGERQSAFRHALLRDAAYSLVTKKERARLHGAAADAFEKRASAAGRIATVLAARHREAAGAPGEAAILWMRAARDAFAAPAWEESLSYAAEAERLGGGTDTALFTGNALLHLARYPEALELFESVLADPATPLRSRALLQKARICSKTSRLAEAEEATGLALEHADDDEFRIEILGFRAELQSRRGRAEAARESLALAHGILAGRPPGSRSAYFVAHAEGQVLFCCGDSQGALRAFESALEFQRRHGNAFGVLGCLNSLGQTRHRLGDFEGAARALETAIAGQREIGDRRGVATCLLNLGLVHQWRGDYARAVEAEEESLRLHLEIGDGIGAASAHSNLGIALFRSGKPEAALAEHRAALAILRVSGIPAALANCLGNIGNVLFDRGEYAEAALAQEESIAIQRRVGNRLGLACSLGNLASIRLAQGACEEALRGHLEALALKREIGDLPGAANSLTGVGTTRHALGELAEAASPLEESLDLRRRLGDRPGIAESLASLAALLASRGDFEAAIRATQESVAISAEIGNRSLEALGHFETARVHHLRGDDAAACREISVAISLRRALGERPGVAEGLAFGALYELRDTSPAGAAKLLESIGEARAVGEGFWTPLLKAVADAARASAGMPAGEDGETGRLAFAHRFAVAEARALAHRALGDPVESRRLLDEGIALAEAHGAPGEAAPLRALRERT